MDGDQIKVALYARVSTEDQAKEGFSLYNQIDKLRSYCIARSWDIYNEFIDEGYSGRNLKRPSYQKMMREIKNWNVLLVLKMDRIHRNSKNFMIMMDELTKFNKEFVSLNEALDTSTAMGRFVTNIIQLIAQLESEQIGERVYAGMEQKASTNRGYLGFNIPLGYDYKNNELLINKKEEKVVNNIFSFYLQGKSLGFISDLLNKNKIQTKKGGIWAKKTISSILKNPLYCGYIKWENYLNKNDHQSIIRIDEFNMVQNLIEKKGGIPSKIIKK